MGAKEEFIALLSQHGQDVHFHRGDSQIPCPCLTPEGFRDPAWHDAHPSEPICDENGMLPDPAHTTDLMVKAFVQPSQSTRATRMSPEYLTSMFGEIQKGDHIGIFPPKWNGVEIQFYDWGQSGEDWLEYNGRWFTVVAQHLIPDPETGDPDHHWEIGMRISSEPING